MNLKESYKREEFIDFLKDFLPDFQKDVRPVMTGPSYKAIKNAELLGLSNQLDLAVFEFKIEGNDDKKIYQAKEGFKLMKSHQIYQALAIYWSIDDENWRFSLMQMTPERTESGKITQKFSNPRRFSYVLGPGAKVATPSKMLQGIVETITDLENKFSLAVVSKEFFTRIATQYSKLVGGIRGEGGRALTFPRTLEIRNSNEAVNANFAIRLIGRLVFCWFLKQKKGHLNNFLIPNDIFSVSAVRNIGDYYHTICVPLFFEVLNKPQSSRPVFSAYAEFFDKVPYLNGGLFQDHVEDNHKFNRATGMSERRGVVNIPDIWFSELFQIFEEYNFTIDENTSIDTELSIDPEMLGRIFENLLAEVNPETGESARKSTGSFYTPREIVDFMVEESLITHLKTKTNISEEKLRALSSYNLDDDISNPIDQQERKILVEAIHDTTVLDPACGSGAFPIGILQRLVHMLEVLDPECSIYLSKIPSEIRRQLQKHSLNYVRKLGVIRECIHGVDIQPIAIDISRLRCFLTLVVDQQVDDNAPNRGIEPLPNLDFKFVCANTLIKPPIHEGPLFGDEFADALGEHIDEYFAPTDQLHKSETARKLQQLISDRTSKELESIIRSYSYLNNEKYKQALAKKNEQLDNERIRINSLWKSYENIFLNKPVGFFDNRYFFPVVYRNGGFDIVIANPPYLRERGNKSRFEEVNLSELGKKYHQGKMDFWFYFLHRSIDLIKDNGIIAFITSRYWLNNTGAKKLIKRVSSELSFVDFVDIGKLKVFDSVAGQHMVAVYKKTKDIDSFIYKKLENDISDISTDHDTVNLKIKKLSNSSIFSNDEIILEKTDNVDNVVLLGSICDISVGAQESPDKISVKQIKNLKRTDVCAGDGVFVLSQGELDDLCPNRTEALTIKKYLDPSDIFKYGLTWRNKYLIYSDKNTKEKIKGEQDFINLRKHLDKYADFITSSNKPYGLHRPRESRYFTNPKIIFKGMFVDNEFVLDDMGYFTGFSFSLIIKKDPNYNLKYILAVLNSKFALEWFCKNGKKRGAGLDIGVIKLRQFPIKIASTAEQKTFIEIVDKILDITKSDNYLTDSAKKAKVHEYESQIDQMVYKLYDLTPEEIKIVEDSVK